MRLPPFFLVLALLLPTSRPLCGQRTIEIEGASAEGPRLALIIGNGGYPVGPLRNPTNDARAMARTLSALGFEVTHVEDGTLREMETAVRDFGRALRRGGTGLFYYAGHGLQVQGENYLVPVSARIEKEEDVRYEAMAVGRVLAEMEAAGNDLNLVILDACRNNPFARSWRSDTRGLAQVAAPTGTLIAYATAPGSVASDGDGANGLYTEQLLNFMAVPDLPVEEMFKQVRIAVMERTNGLQTPWESSSLVGHFAFQGATTPAPATAPASSARPVAGAPAGGGLDDADLAGRRMLAESLALVGSETLARVAQLGLRPVRRVFHETFSDGGSAWCQKDAEGDLLKVVAGRYHMRDSTDGTWCRVLAPHDDVLIRFEIRWEEGATNEGGGVFFRNDGWEVPRSYVALETAEENGRWIQVGTLDTSLPAEEQWLRLVPWTSSDLLVEGRNVVEIVVTGSTLTLFLNGSLAQTVGGVFPASGQYLGFFALGALVTYSFDDLVVLALEPGP